MLVSGRLRLLAIVLLLPVGFAAGAATDVVHPDALLGNAYQPIVSLGVGVILFETGLRLPDALQFEDVCRSARPPDAGISSSSLLHCGSSAERDRRSTRSRS